VEEIELFVI